MPAVSNGFSCPLGLLCFDKRLDITNVHYIEPISVSLECSIYPGSTVHENLLKKVSKQVTQSQSGSFLSLWEIDTSTLRIVTL